MILRNNAACDEHLIMSSGRYFLLQLCEHVPGYQMCTLCTRCDHSYARVKKENGHGQTPSHCISLTSSCTILIDLLQAQANHRIAVSDCGPLFSVYG